MPGSQDFMPDTRNKELLVLLNGKLVPAHEAQVSLFDAGFALGDGVWAPAWYASVEQSTGFAAPADPGLPPLPDHLQPIADEALPYYAQLAAYRISSRAAG